MEIQRLCHEPEKLQVKNFRTLQVQGISLNLSTEIEAMTLPGTFKSIITAVFIFLSATSFADENSVFISLKKYTSNGDTIGVRKNLGEISFNEVSYSGEDFGKLLDDCIARSERSGLPLIQDFLTLKAKWYRTNHDITRSAATYTKVYEYLSKNNREHEGVWILIEIGNLFFATNNFVDAASFYKRAESLSDKLKDKYALSVINLNLSLIETANKNYPSAISYLKRCISLREGTKENAFVSHSYIKLSEIYSLMDQMDSVLYYVKAAEHLYYAEGTNVGALENMPALIGMAYYKYFSSIGNTRIAEMNLMKARAYMRMKGLDARLFDSYITAGEFELSAGNAQRVIDSLTYILPRIEQSSFTEIYSSALHILAKASHDFGSYNASRQYYEKFIAMIEGSGQQISITKTSVADILHPSSKPKAQQPGVIQDKKDPLNTILVILLVASVFTAVYIRSLLSRQKKRNSELKRELERQQNDFNEKLRKRADAVN